MASPFVPVPVPMDRTLSGGRSKSRRPQRAASLGSVSSSSESSSPVARTTIKEQDSRFQSSFTDGTPPPPVQSPVTRARMNGPLEPCVEFSNCPHSACGSAGSQEAEERPITPTVLGYEVMEERAKFTVPSWKTDHFVTMVTNSRTVYSPQKKKTGFLSIFFVNSYIFISYNFKAACLCPLGLQDPCQEESRPELGHLSKICRLLKTQRQGQLRWATCGRRCTSTSRSPEVFPSSPCFQTLYLPLAFSVFAVVLEGNVAD